MVTHGHKDGKNRYWGPLGRQEGKAKRAEKLHIVYYAHYLDDGISHTPKLHITQHSHVRNMCIYALNLK